MSDQIKPANLPIYFGPDAMKRAALNALARIDMLPQDVWLAPETAMDSEGNLVFKLMKKSSRAVRVMAFMAKSHLRDVPRAHRPRQYAYMHVVEHLAGYAALWLLADPVDGQGNAVRREDMRIVGFQSLLEGLRGGLGLAGAIAQAKAVPLAEGLWATHALAVLHVQGWCRELGHDGERLWQRFGELVASLQQEIEAQAKAEGEDEAEAESAPLLTQG